MTTILGRYMSSARTTKSAALFYLTCIVFSSNFAYAQMPDISTEHVKIDLSVINDPGPRKSSLPYYRNSRESKPRLDLLLPGSSAPTSRLHISIPKATGKIKLKLENKAIKPSKQILKKAKKKEYSNQVKIKKPVLPTITATKPPAPLVANNRKGCNKTFYSIIDQRLT
jgi:hypothetical protein